MTDPLPKKQYFRIGEVARLLDIPSHVLRYWETEFRAVRPSKSASGQRVYSRRDVERLQLIKRLLRDERYTIEGARRALKERGLDDDANAPAKPEALRAALVHARERLEGLLDARDALPPLLRPGVLMDWPSLERWERFAVSVLAMGTMMGTFVKTESQAGGMSIMLGMVMGLLGGCMWPLELFPPAMQKIVHVLPTTWAMQALTDLTMRGEGLLAVLPEIGVLLGFAVVFFVVGVKRFRYE